MLPDINELAYTDIPVCLPQVEIYPGQVELITKLVLTSGQQLDIRLLGIQLVKWLNVTSGVSVYTTALPAVYIGLFYGITYNFTRGEPLIYAGCMFPSFNSTLSTVNRTFTTPGTYEFALVNNSTTSPATVVLTGAARIS